MLAALGRPLAALEGRASVQRQIGGDLLQEVATFDASARGRAKARPDPSPNSTPTATPSPTPNSNPNPTEDVGGVSRRHPRPHVGGGGQPRLYTLTLSLNLPQDRTLTCLALTPCGQPRLYTLTLSLNLPLKAAP